MDNKKTIAVGTEIHAPVEKVWEFYTKPEHIVKWNQASEDWHSPKAENDLRKGGKFNTRMESKDGKEGFDFTGIYNDVVNNSLIDYTMDDGRNVKVEFGGHHDHTHMTVVFEAEEENSLEIQKEGWQSILDSFKNYVETHS